METWKKVELLYLGNRKIYSMHVNIAARWLREMLRLELIAPCFLVVLKHRTRCNFSYNDSFDRIKAKGNLVKIVP